MKEANVNSFKWPNSDNVNFELSRFTVTEIWLTVLCYQNKIIINYVTTSF